MDAPGIRLQTGPVGGLATQRCAESLHVLLVRFVEQNVSFVVQLGVPGVGAPDPLQPAITAASNLNEP